MSNQKETRIPSFITPDEAAEKLSRIPSGASRIIGSKRPAYGGRTLQESGARTEWQRKRVSR